MVHRPSRWLRCWRAGHREDETLQRDMLRGLEQAMVGRAQVTMPAG